MLFELITGRLPFEADSSFGLLLLHLNQPAPSLRSLTPDVPPAVDRIVQKAMAKDPRERYQHAGQLFAELRDAWGYTLPHFDNPAAQVPEQAHAYQSA